VFLIDIVIVLIEDGGSTSFDVECLGGIARIRLGKGSVHCTIWRSPEQHFSQDGTMIHNTVSKFWA
jgi:hypothetical protein